MEAKLALSCRCSVLPLKLQKLESEENGSRRCVHQGLSWSQRFSLISRSTSFFFSIVQLIIKLLGVKGHKQELC